MYAERALPERWLKVGQEVKQICFTFRSFCLFDLHTGLNLLAGEACDFSNASHFYALIFAALQGQIPRARLRTEISFPDAAVEKHLKEALASAEPPQRLVAKVAALNADLAELAPRPQPTAEEPEENVFDWLIFSTRACVKYELTADRFWAMTPAQLEAMHFVDLQLQKMRLEAQKQTTGQRELSWEALLMKMPEEEREKILNAEN